MRFLLVLLISMMAVLGCESETVVTNNITLPSSPTPIFQPQVPVQTPIQQVPCTFTTPTTQCPPSQLDPPARRVPEIMSFGSDSPRVSRHGFATLRWEVSDFNAQVRIDPNIGSVSTVGFIVVFLTQTTTYTLTARNSLGIAQRQFTIFVSQETD